jgi:TolB-like protein
MNEAPIPAPSSDEATPGDSPAPKKKKKDKVRSAWISFIGRIVAQIVGAVASIALALMFLQKTQSTDRPTEGASPVAPSAASARPVARRSDGRITLAVLPLSNHSGEAQQEYFVDGMTEALIADLAQIDALRVISRTSVMRYRDQKKSIPEVAQELGVDAVVEGSVARIGDRVRVTAQLIDASSDEHLWARSYERTLRDVFALQGEVASAIAKEVRAAITPIQQRRLAERAAVDPVAYDLYLRGRHAWNLRSDSAMKTAAAYFKQAIDKQPTFALAYAGLADVYVLNASVATSPAEQLTQALAAANRALELDDGLAEAHTSRAGIYFFRERNRSEAEREFRRALELNPGYPTARQWYAVLLAELGRDGEARQHANEAAILDPYSGTMRQTLGLVHYYGRRYPEAITELRKAVELSPTLPLAPVLLAKSLFLTGNYDEVIRIGEAAPRPRSADLEAITALAYVRKRDSAHAEQLVASMKARRPTPVMPLAYWFAVTGDVNASLSLLERNDGSTAPAPIAVDPLFDNLRNDPRFQALVANGRL